MVWKLLIPLSQRFLMREPWAPAGAAAAPAFAAVVVEEPPRTEAAAAAVLEIVVGEVVIRAPRAADEAQLARAIRAARTAVAR